MINKKGAMVSKTLLWTNQNPTAYFYAQTLNVDVSGYDALIVKFAEDVTYPTIQYKTNIIKNNTDSVLVSGVNGDVILMFRTIKFQDNNKVIIGGGLQQRGSTQYHWLVVPQEIYGIKGLKLD